MPIVSTHSRSASLNVRKQWLVYMVECSDKSIYTGITNNIEKRLTAHNNGAGAKYTKTRRPVKLLITFKVKNKSEAAKLEYKIKQLTRKEKLDLINKTLADANVVPTKTSEGT